MPGDPSDDSKSRSRKGTLSRYFVFFYFSFYWAGFTVAQRERAQEDFNVPYEGAPPHPPHICIRKTATAPGSPYTFRIVRGFFYVPQNYQHSRNCETGPPALSSLSEKTRNSNHLQVKLQRQHFLLSYLKTLSVGPVGVSNSQPPASQPGEQPSELPVGGYDRERRTSNTL